MADRDWHYEIDSSMNHGILQMTVHPDQTVLAHEPAPGHM